MRFISIFALFSIVSLSACGGSPTDPSTVIPPVGGDVPVTSNPARTVVRTPLTISPASVTLRVGQSQVFTSSGGDGFYILSPAMPYQAFRSEMDPIVAGKITVTAVARDFGSTGTVEVENLTEKATARITIVP